MTNGHSEIEQPLSQMSDIASNPSLLACRDGLHCYGNVLKIIPLKHKEDKSDADSDGKSEPVE